MQYNGIERRKGFERRNHTLAAHLFGGLRPRRYDPRRTTDRIYPIIDWHSPRVLAVVVAVFGLCAIDGVFTVILISHGAIELNPLMALFLPDRPVWFAIAKLFLTALGVFVLVACSRMRFLRIVPGELALYAVLLSYVALVMYEAQLLELIE